MPPQSRIHLRVSIADQEMRLYENGDLSRSYAISSSKFGTGETENSNCTPLGEFSIVEMIGGECQRGTQFKSRKVEGLWDKEDQQQNDEDLILSRILWLEGLEDHNSNTKDRYIYIHGTNQENHIGTEASMGCIRMMNADVIDLYDRVEEGTPVTIVT